MEQKRTAIQERLERFRQGKPSESTVKKRRFSGAIFAVNVLLLLLLLFNVKKPHQEYYISSSISYDQALYRFSISRSGKSREYFVSLTLQSNAPAPRSFVFDSSVARVLLQHDGTMLYQTLLGSDSVRLALKPGEVKNFTRAVEDEHIRLYIREHPEAIKPPRKSYLFAEKQFIPMLAEIHINTEKKLSLALNFNYEIE